MIQSAEQYLEELKKRLKRHPDKDEILQEIAMHLEEEMAHLDISESQAIGQFTRKFGEPAQVAAAFGAVSSGQPNAAKRNIVYLNAVFFALGLLLSVGVHMKWPYFSNTWMFLAGYSWFLLLGYSGLWLLIGFLFGKEFGAKGKIILAGALKLALIPNLLLMAAALFGLLSSSWFSLLLDDLFMISCTMITGLFLPASILCCRFGARKAV